MADPGGSAIAAKHIVAVAFQQVFQDREPRSLGLGGALRERDLLALQVKVDRDVYLYVGQLSPPDTFQRLFPAVGETDHRVRAGEVIRVPQGQGLEVRPGTGAEHLYVITSLRPLSAAELYQDANDTALAWAARASAAAQGAGLFRTATGPVKGSDRSLGIKLEDEGAWLRVQAVDPGIAVADLWFQHRQE